MQVPPLEPSIGLVAEAALDRMFVLGMNALSGLPPSATVRRVQNELGAAQSLFEEQGWIKDPCSYHRTPPAITDFVLSRSRSRQGRRRIDYDHLAFESGYRPHVHEPGRERWLEFDDNRTAHAYVLQHAGSPRPWLVCVHGFAMGSPLVCFRGFDAEWLHHELGLNVLMPVLPLHGPRTRGRLSGRDLLSLDFMNMVHGFAQAVWDIRRCIRWLRAQDVDEIGLYGLSLGGYNTALVSALEPDLSCVIAGIPAVDFPTVVRANLPWLMRRSNDEFVVNWDRLRAVTHVVSPLAMMPLVPRERRFIYAGIADRIAQPSQARALWRHWDEPDIHWFQGSHIGYHWKRCIRPFTLQALGVSGML